jgi:hypothetical protein
MCFFIKNIYIHKMSPNSLTKTRRYTKSPNCIKKLCPKFLLKVGKEVFKIYFQNPYSNLKTNYLLIAYTTFCFHWLICFLNIMTSYFGFHPWNPCYVQHDLMLRSTISTILPWLLVVLQPIYIFLNLFHLALP